MSFINWYADSTRGIREKNDDSYLAMKTGNSLLFVVADGLGGHPSGEMASAILNFVLSKIVR